MTQFQDLVSFYEEHFETLVDQNGEVLATQRDRDLGIAILLSGSRGVREKLRLRYMAQHDSKTPR